MGDLHMQLVDRAERWLRGTKRCGVVLTERSCGATGETPDAIGWAKCGGFSIVVECKSSRADFLRDAKKPWRAEGTPALGRMRYFLAFPGVVKPDDDLRGWGLVEVCGSVCRVVTESQGFDNSERKELGFLYSFARRAQLGVEPTVGCLLPACDSLAAEKKAVEDVAELKDALEARRKLHEKEKNELDAEVVRLRAERDALKARQLLPDFAGVIRSNVETALESARAHPRGHVELSSTWLVELLSHLPEAPASKEAVNAT